MNKTTLARLAKNPHYKLNPKQQEELAGEDRQPMETFGGFDIHDTALPLHPTSPPRSNRISKKTKQKQE